MVCVCVCVFVTYMLWMIDDGTGKWVLTFHLTTHSKNYLKYTEGYLTTNIKLLDANSHTYNNILKKCIHYPSSYPPPPPNKWGLNGDWFLHSYSLHFHYCMGLLKPQHRTQPTLKATMVCVCVCVCVCVYSMVLANKHPCNMYRSII